MREPQFKVGDRVYFIYNVNEEYNIYNLAYLLNRAKDLPTTLCKRGVIKEIEMIRRIDEYRDHYNESYKIHATVKYGVFTSSFEVDCGVKEGVKPKFMAYSEEELKTKILSYIQVELEKLNKDCAELTEEFNQLKGK